MRKWAGAFIITAMLDILTTSLSLSSGAIETNPFFGGLNIEEMAIVKVGLSLLLVYLCVRFKLKTLLILGVGANAGVVMGNLMAIWTLRTM